MAKIWPGACAAGVLLAVITPVLAANSEWAQELTFQIKDEVGCEVSLISQVVERTVGGKRIVMAKVHCEDRRTFDAFRDEEFADFKFNECDPPEQRAC
jgi:hypothetical protein